MSLMERSITNSIECYLVVSLLYCLMFGFSCLPPSLPLSQPLPPLLPSPLLYLTNHPHISRLYAPSTVSLDFRTPMGSNRSNFFSGQQYKILLPLAQWDPTEVTFLVGSSIKFYLLICQCLGSGRPDKSVPIPPFPDSPIPNHMIHGDRSYRTGPDEELPPISEEATPSPIIRRTLSVEVSKFSVY